MKMKWFRNSGLKTIFLNRNSPASTMARDLNMDGNHISYLRESEQNHHVVTKGCADTKLSLLGGSMQGLGLGLLETGFHTWVSLFRAVMQSDCVMQTNSI